METSVANINMGGSVIASVVSNEKMGYIVVMLNGEYTRIWRKYLKNGGLNYCAGDKLALHISDNTDENGRPVLTDIFNNIGSTESCTNSKGPFQATVVSAEKIGYIVVNHNGEYIRIWRKYMENGGQSYQAGDRITIYISESIDEYGKHILSNYYIN